MPLEKIAVGRILTPVWRPTRTFNLAWLEVLIDDKSGGPAYFTEPLTVQLWEAPSIEMPNPLGGTGTALAPGAYEARAEVHLSAGDQRAVRAAVNAWGEDYEPCRLRAGNWVICVASRPNWAIDEHSPTISVVPHGTYA